MRIVVNRKEIEVPGPLTVEELLAHLGHEGGRVAVAVGDEVVTRERWASVVVREGEHVEIVRAIGGGEGPWAGRDPYDPAGDPLVIAGRTFRSRLFVGTGKYPDAATMQAALERSGTEMVTVAIRYMDFSDPRGGDILAHLDLSRYHLLPNTAGAYTVEDAVKMARLAREATGTNWIKLEVIGDRETLLPDLSGTLEATRILVKEGFVVLPYTTADLVTCLRLEEAGAAAVMPLASLIGSGQGLVDWTSLRRVIERVKVPVVVDAGIGSPADAAHAMELGAAAVLINTAIAKARVPALMAEAMRWAVIAGRQGFLAGRIPRLEGASPSSPTAGVPLAGAGATAVPAGPAPLRRPEEVE